jgi:hypothetical protein
MAISYSVLIAVILFTGNSEAQMKEELEKKSGENIKMKMQEEKHKKEEAKVVKKSQSMNEPAIAHALLGDLN